MTYVGYSNLCAKMVRNCLKEPYRSESINREQVHFSISKWADGKPEKPSKFSLLFSLDLIRLGNRLGICGFCYV